MERLLFSSPLNRSVTYMVFLKLILWSGAALVFIYNQLLIKPNGEASPIYFALFGLFGQVCACVCELLPFSYYLQSFHSPLLAPYGQSLRHRLLLEKHCLHQLSCPPIAFNGWTPQSLIIILYMSAFMIYLLIILVKAEACRRQN